MTIDDKGRMISPFNLTSTVQANSNQPSIMHKTARSQSKLHPMTSSNSNIKNPTIYSPDKVSLKHETNFMYQFGKSSPEE